MKRLPAEWEPQQALILTWPHPATDWADQLAEVEPVYLELVRAASRHQRVLILCPDSHWQQHVVQQLNEHQISTNAILFAIAPTNDTWVRDYGPITVLTDQNAPIVMDFRFNGWGGKFAAERDDQVNARLHAAGCFENCPCKSSELVLEGGAIDSDGAGTLLLMRRTVIDPARNPGWSQTQVEAELTGKLGSRHFAWLDHGQLSGDDTDGHIDTLARFVAPGVICHATCENPRDPDHDSIMRMIEQLHELRDAAGNPYRLIRLPQPRPVHDATGQRLPAGYANFALINGAVLLPIYQDPADQEASACLQGLFPDRVIRPIDCRALIHQGGSLHCACMQLPAQVALAPSRV